MKIAETTFKGSMKRRVLRRAGGGRKEINLVSNRGSCEVDDFSGLEQKH